MADFKIKSAVLGAVSTNVYFLINEETKEVLLVDPADEAKLIIRYLDGEVLKPAAILLTHGHFDHILAAAPLREHYHIDIYCHEEENPLLEDPLMNSSALFDSRHPYSLSPDHTLKDGDELTLAGFPFRVLHTPGHTAGSCCFYFPEEGILFSGDTLFYGSYGRTDLPTGDDRQMEASVNRLLDELPPKTTVFPGHGPKTQIGFEKKYNPLARGL